MRPHLIVLMLSALAVTGCAQKMSFGPADAAWTVRAGPDRVWPEPPAQPRIRYLRTIETAGDLGFEAPMVERFFDLLVGERDQKIARPYALAVHGRMLAVTDPGSQSVHFLDLNGEFYRQISGAGDTPFLSPVGIALGDDRIHVADSAHNTVFTLNLEGKLVRKLTKLERPTGLAFDPAAGHLYIAETTAHRISVYDRTGDKVDEITGFNDGAMRFNAPTHITFRDGVLVVNDTMNFRIVALDRDGKSLWFFGKQGKGSGQIYQSKGVDLDSEGHIYVADSMFDRVQIFDQTGQFLLAFGGPGRGLTEMTLPAGIFLEDDRIFVADSRNMRVHVFEYLGGEKE